MNKKIAIVIGCHNKEDLLLAHLDILHFLPILHDPLVVYSGDKKLPIPFIPYPVQDKHTSGAAMAILYGIKFARDLGYDMMIYRNADDWFFNHSLILEWITKINKIGGYNWFGCNKNDNLALNEVYINLKCFRNKDLELKAHEFCEYQIAELLELNDFFRLPGREHEAGIGKIYEDEWLAPLPEENNRWFNKKWQLITSHDDEQRRKYYRQIRLEIPYVEELEKRKWFKSWYCKKLGSTLNPA